MSEKERISPFVRVVSGAIGMLGFAAIASPASQYGGPKLYLVLFACFFAGPHLPVRFLFGKYPWNKTKADESDD